MGPEHDLPQVPPTATRPPGKPQAEEEGLAPQIWVAGLIATIIILLVVFSIVL
jgi:hypothetical protein